MAILTEFLTGIANAIRKKTLKAGTINAQDFATEIEGIEPIYDNLTIDTAGEYDVTDYKKATVTVLSESDEKLIALIEGTLTTLEVPYGTTTIKKYAFTGKFEQQPKIYIPVTVTTVQNGFYQTTNTTMRYQPHVYYAGTLEQWFNISNGVTTEYYLYINDEEITEVNDVLNVNAEQFTGIILNKVTLADGVTLSENAFTNAPVYEIVFNGGVNGGELPDYCFAKWGYQDSYKIYRNITLPSGITKIPYYGFHYCEIDELIVPEGVTLIDSYAFYQADVKTLSLPSTLTEIKMYGIPNGTTLIMNATTPPSLVSASIKTSGKIYVPNGTLTAYQSADGWSSKASLMVEKNTVTVNVPASLLNNSAFTYSIDNGETWNEFNGEAFAVEEVALMKFKSTTADTTVLIGSTAGGSDIGTIANSELTYATSGNITIYLTVSE